MRITFENMPAAKAERTTTAYQSAQTGNSRVQRGYTLDISDQVTDNAAYSFRKGKGVSGGGRSADDIMQAAAGQDITLYHNYMAVMSNSMSDEDFAKLQEEGYNPADMDPRDAVTILDTIKAQLVKAGVEITGYTDTLDRDALTRITGSAAYADQLAGAFAREDIPLTEENVAQAMDAFGRGKELTEMSDGAVKYMVTNEYAPTIDALYLAQHAGAADAGRQAGGYFSEDMPGYYAQKAPTEDIAGLQGQIDHILEAAGYPSNEENRQDAIWLIEKGIPFTEESFSLLKEIENVELPARDEDLFSAIAAALAEGKSAAEANLEEKKSIYRRAADCLEDYENRFFEIQNMPDTPETVKARRQLEEVRLHMTVEANVRLLKSGFAIDTAPIEDTIAALKQWEQERATTAFSDALPVDICSETLRKTAEFENLPSVTLGRLITLGQPLTVNTIHETGTGLREIFRQAGETYEAMLTTPRADMGDSIHTAFRNVDALLQNMGQELTDENRKAVRSLSYNRMELTEENLLAVKGADRVVQRVVEKMTPSSVLSMIRDGVNPLTTPMDELESYLEGQDTYREESEKYSRFLYNMEKNREITQEEKDSYIGIYRMLRQIEKSDGAAVGSLVGAQAEINFSNLLSAVRTGKVKGVNVSVDDHYGSLEETLAKGVSIDTQIDAAYNRQQLEQIRQLNMLDDAPLKMLWQLEQPVTAENLLAADAIQKDGADSFKKLRETDADALENLLEDGGFDSDVEETFTDKERMQAGYERLTEQAQGLARELTFAEKTGSLDIRILQAASRQLGIQGARGRRDQEYDIPQIIDGELTSVHLKLIHDSQEKGRVSVSMNTTGYGYLSGEFSMEGDTVSGFFAGQSEEAVNALRESAGHLEGKLGGSGLKAERIQVIKGSLTERQDNVLGGDAETKQLYRVAGMIIAAWKESL